MTNKQLVKKFKNKELLEREKSNYKKYINTLDRRLVNLHKEIEKTIEEKKVFIDDYEGTLVTDVYKGIPLTIKKINWYSTRTSIQATGGKGKRRATVTSYGDYFGLRLDKIDPHAYMYGKGYRTKKEAIQVAKDWIVSGKKIVYGKYAWY